jgi:cytosine/adenosine deaminase-related metal-dependent hydrolase
MGIPVGLGTDDYYHDMCDLVRKQRSGVMARAEKVSGYLGMVNESKRTARPSFYEMLWLATMGGARALGMDTEVGSLEPGKKADVITFDLMNPYMTPTRDPVTSVFLYGTPADIDNVICDGAFLKRDRRLTTIDAEKALLGAQATCDQIIDRFFQEHPDQRRIWEQKATR